MTRGPRLYYTNPCILRRRCSHEGFHQVPRQIQTVISLQRCTEKTKEILYLPNSFQGLRLPCLAYHFSSFLAVSPTVDQGPCEEPLANPGAPLHLPAHCRVKGCGCQIHSSDLVETLELSWQGLIGQNCVHWLGLYSHGQNTGAGNPSEKVRITTGWPLAIVPANHPSFRCCTYGCSICRTWACRTKLNLRRH